MPNERLSAALKRWTDSGRSQMHLAKAAEVTSSALSRMFSGEIRPERGTFGKMLLAIAEQDVLLAADTLVAYLRDGVPDGEAVDSRTWQEWVSIEANGPTRTAETDTPPDELELALAYIAKTAHETKHGKQFVLGFYRLRHPDKRTTY